jgi:pSer/pThr/pTyr-binding forkhead associated (FHA) protein
LGIALQDERSHYQSPWTLGFIPQFNLRDLTGIPNEGIVSRRHGRVSWDWSQNAYTIVDMSTNGIYLNGTPLSPGVQYRLLNGDFLHFGQDNIVRFTVYIM